MNIFVDSTSAVEGIELRHDAHGSSCERWGGNYVDTGDEDSAGRGEGSSSADTDGGRLAGAVWTKKSVQFSFSNSKFDAVDRHNTLFSFVNFTKAFNLDN